MIGYNCTVPSAKTSSTLTLFLLNIYVLYGTDCKCYARMQETCTYPDYEYQFISLTVQYLIVPSLISALG